MTKRDGGRRAGISIRASEFVAYCRCDFGRNPLSHSNSPHERGLREGLPHLQAKEYDNGRVGPAEITAGLKFSSGAFDAAVSILQDQKGRPCGGAILGP
jgi:hypothetical protein